MNVYIAWVANPNRIGGYSYIGAKKDGKIICQCKNEDEARQESHKLNVESGASGNYIVVFDLD